MQSIYQPSEVLVNRSYSPIKHIQIQEVLWSDDHQSYMYKVKCFDSYGDENGQMTFDEEFISVRFREPFLKGEV